MLTHKNYLRLMAFSFAISLVLVSLAPAQLGPQPVAFVTVKKQYYSAQRERRNYVIKNRDDWQSLWELVHAYHVPQPDLPDIDFSEQMIIAVFMGEFPSSGHIITITELLKNGKKLTVKVTETTAGRSCVTAPAFSQPYHIIATDKVRKVKFKVKQEIHDCG